MAIMIPEKPRDFDPYSREDIMFNHLRDLLPDDYYVVHSFQINKIKEKDNGIFESEADFVIFNRNKGILCLEAKATHVKYYNGRWYYHGQYGDKEMHSGGPVAQARRSMHAIKDYMNEHGMESIVDNCKFLHAVWFPMVSEEYMRKIPCTPEISHELIMTEEALYDPQKYIERIFAYNDHGKTETTINESMAMRIVNEVLCPHFDIAPTATYDIDTKHIIFHRLLREQTNVLNFLDEQRTAIINGAAGTGKTLVAVEKAKRHASRGEKVLFLCVNAMLRDHLAKSYPNEYIDFYNISGYACTLCHTPTPDYELLNSVLMRMWDEGSFPYKHIIVDEGQDFGQTGIEESNVLETLWNIVDNTVENGSFYVFYDKLQLVQARKLPACIVDADCKLTLYRNCRNTENIAKTSLRPVSERAPRLMENCIVGVPAKMHFCSDTDSVLAALDDTLDSLISEHIEDIVILTANTEKVSVIKDYISKGSYPAGKISVMFTSHRKFKGLEADAVIIVDIDRNTFIDDNEHKADDNSSNVFSYYVSASRAKLRLDMITQMDDADCIAVLEKLGKTAKPKRAKRDLARALNALCEIHE